MNATRTPQGRVFNFSSGPATLPLPVLEQVRDELLDWRGTGISVMEMSHRSKAFDTILAHALSITRELLQVPDTHEILFLQGGASLQFSMVPMNFALAGRPMAFIHTGQWTEGAIKEARKVGELRIVASSEADRWTKIPPVRTSDIPADASYLHLCSNNTIEGTQFQTFPSPPAGVPIVADMSSDFLSRPLNVADFGLIFAGAQKNLGPSGVTMVIVRKDLAERASAQLPSLLQYRTHIAGGSRANTPPTFSIYVCGLVMEWIKANGGLAGMEKRNAAKAALLYRTLDENADFYRCPVDPAVRSPMNVVWRIIDSAGKPNEGLEEAFVKEAAARGLVELKGHRSVGGLRASLYNAMPSEGVRALIEFMGEFRRSRHA